MAYLYQSNSSIYGFINKTPQVGFEPTTNRLTADRSTTELLRIEATSR